MPGDDDLYARGAAALLTSWEEYARGSSGAALLRLSGAAANPGTASVHGIGGELVVRPQAGLL